MSPFIIGATHLGSGTQGTSYFLAGTLIFLLMIIFRVQNRNDIIM